MKPGTYDTGKLTGLFGGTFDPIHYGHLNVARAIVERGQLEQILLIPAFRPPHKKNVEISDARHRMHMIQLAIADQPALFLSDFEIARSEISYTTDTAAHFASVFKKPVTIVIGTDSLADLHTWRDARQLASDYPFLIYRRPGTDQIDKDGLTARFGNKLADKLCGSIIGNELWPVSATAIRDLIGLKKDLSHLVPKAVLEYIKTHQLYETENYDATRQHKPKRRG